VLFDPTDSPGIEKTPQHQADNHSKHNINTAVNRIVSLLNGMA
jgi:hypothetical protein